MRHHRGPANGRILIHRRLRGEWIQFTSSVTNLRHASSQQPQSAALIEIARISRAMPDQAIDAKLRLLVAASVQITCQYVFTTDNDLARLIRSATLRLEFCLRPGIDRRSPAIAQNAQSNAIDGNTREQSL